MTSARAAACLLLLAAATAAAGSPRWPPPGPTTWLVQQRAHFLSAFRGRCISFSGDSVSREMFWSLLLWAHGCSGNGTAPAVLLREADGGGGGGDDAAAPPSPSGAPVSDAVDDGSGMGAREFHARFVARGLARAATCAWFHGNIKKKVRRVVHVPVDASPEHDIVVRWQWAPYVSDLLRAGDVLKELGSGGCDVFVLNAGFWNLRRARTPLDRKPDVRALVRSLDEVTGPKRAAAARHSVVWRSCTPLELTAEPEHWFDNRHIGAFNKRVDGLWRAAGFAALSVVRVFAGIVPNASAGHYHLTRDGVHPVFALQVRMLRLVLTEALGLKLRAQLPGWAPPTADGAGGGGGSGGGGLAWPPLAPKEALAVAAALRAEHLAAAAAAAAVPAAAAATAAAASHSDDASTSLAASPHPGVAARSRPPSPHAAAAVIRTSRGGGGGGGAHGSSGAVDDAAQDGSTLDDGSASEADDDDGDFIGSGGAGGSSGSGGGSDDGFHVGALRGADGAGTALLGGGRVDPLSAALGALCVALPLAAALACLLLRPAQSARLVATDAEVDTTAGLAAVAKRVVVAPPRSEQAGATGVAGAAAAVPVAPPRPRAPLRFGARGRLVLPGALRRAGVRVAPPSAARAGADGSGAAAPQASPG